MARYKLPARAQIIEQANAGAVTVTRWTCEQSGGAQTDYKPVRTDYIVCTNADKPNEDTTLRYTGRNLTTADEIMHRAQFVAEQVRGGVEYFAAAAAADDAGRLGRCHRHPEQVHAAGGADNATN